jgi:Cu+-exporting ATPase
MALEPVMPSLDEEESTELTDFRRRFWWTLPFSLLALALAMLGHRTTLLSANARSWLELLVTAPVVLWAGWPFFQRWAQSIANRSPNMWTLIGTGVGAAFGYSVVARWRRPFPELPRARARRGSLRRRDHRLVDLLGQVLELHDRAPRPPQAQRGLAPRRRGDQAGVRRTMFP